MDNQITLAEMFYTIRDTQLDLADSVVQLGRILIGILLLNGCAFALMLYQWVSHSMLAPICAALLVTTLAAVFWTWYALPEDIDEALGHENILEFLDK